MFLFFLFRRSELVVVSVNLRMGMNKDMRKEPRPEPDLGRGLPSLRGTQGQARCRHWRTEKANTRICTEHLSINFLNSIDRLSSTFQIICNYLQPRPVLTSTSKVLVSCSAKMYCNVHQCDLPFVDNTFHFLENRQVTLMDISISIS